MKKIKILTIILVIAIITMIAFGGIYTKTQNRMENKVKDYDYTMDLEGYRSIKLSVKNDITTTIKDAEGNEVTDADNLTDEELAEKGYTKEETRTNDESVLNIDNYKKTKKILEKRLEKIGVEQYNIKLNEEIGEIVIEIPENSDTDNIVSNIGTTGKFELLDSQTNEVLMDNNDIKLANVMYGASSSDGTTNSGTTVYLNIEFTKEGTKKLEEISNKYVKTEEKADETENAENTENTENTENAENTEETEKKVTMKIDGSEMMSTSFEEPIKIGKLQLSIGRSAQDKETLQGYVSQANNIAIVLDQGKLPIEYEIEENKYLQSNITNEKINIITYIMIAISAIALIILVVRYKAKGLLGAISYIGFASILLLIVRYTNVALSIEGLLGIAVALVLNYIWVNMLLAKMKNDKEKTSVQKAIETEKEFFLKIIPICIASIVFCFTKWAPISSFGMVMFWGITLIAIYNISITNILLKINEDK